MKIDHAMVKPGPDWLPEHRFTLSNLSWTEMRVIAEALDLGREANDELSSEDMEERFDSDNAYFMELAVRKAMLKAANELLVADGLEPRATL